MADSAGTGGQLKHGCRRFPRFAAAALAALWIAGPAAAGQRIHQTARVQAAPSAAVEPEQLLVKTLLAIKANRLDVALAEVEKVIQAYPNFRLAHLIRGDLLLARSQPLKTMGAAAGVPPDRVADLREEAKARLARYQQERPTDRVPRYLVQLQPDQKYALVVDTARSTLFVFENHNGNARYLADYYISKGKNGIDKLREGDKKTPLGVYHVTSSIPREKLADLYGAGAFPINYPNEWDRREGRKGSGIWLHGTPSDTFSRPPQASDGCVVLTNRDLEAIRQQVQIGLTPVIISSGIEWVTPQAIAGTRQEIAGALEGWRKDWESLDTERYLKHYSPSFTSGAQDYRSFAQQKRQVNAGKQWIKVKLERVSMFLYPGKQKLAVVTFDQDYASSNLNNKMRKRQYWLKEGSAWRIIHEGGA
ncbi:MAG TPA: L,D-transpeptidase family protein [Burkholderiales bacterium]|nr:L,D-transpeptidase family protein [Burkholderiales bacterium]